MLESVTSALTTVIGWVGTVVKSLVTGGEAAGDLNPLLPIFAIGIAVTALMMGIRIIRSFTWGS